VRALLKAQALFSPKAAVALKHEKEAAFWSSWIRRHGDAPDTQYYRRFMMAMGGIDDASFFDDKICVDIGCGPKGSLTWLTRARAAIGVDPLAEEYRKFGIADHRMIYLAARAEEVPLPSRYADVVFSMNSLDHVDDMPAACREIRRLLKAGGHFLASLNLDEPPNRCEPWTLTEPLLEKHLFAGWEREFYRVRPKYKGDDGHFGPYKYFFEEPPPEVVAAGGPRALWCRFRVPLA
jgi:SAM-dependent methyltransferase